MYVCICNTVRQSDLERAVSSGQSFEQFSANTGCAGTCGTCLEDAQAMYQAAQLERRNSKSKLFSVPIMACA